MVELSKVFNHLGQIGHGFGPKFQIALIFLFFEPSECTPDTMVVVQGRFGPSGVLNGGFLLKPGLGPCINIELLEF